MRQQTDSTYVARKIKDSPALAYQKAKYADQKRQLVKSMVENFRWDGKNLYVVWKKPFDDVAKRPSLEVGGPGWRMFELRSSLSIRLARPPRDVVDKYDALLGYELKENSVTPDTTTPNVSSVLKFHDVAAEWIVSHLIYGSANTPRRLFGKAAKLLLCLIR